MGVKISQCRADSLPPCGGGSGWGVVRRGTVVPHLPTPTPDPSPAEPRFSEGSATQQSDRSRQQPTSVGGGEQFAASSNLILTPMTSPGADRRSTRKLRCKFISIPAIA